MKKIITILILALALISCNNESKMKSEIKKWINNNAKDPKSYEFVDLKIIDTMTMGDLANRSIVYDSTEIITHDFASLVSTQKELEDIEKKMSEEILLLKKYRNNQTIFVYVVKHKFRIKNGFGGMNLSEWLCVFDKDANLLIMEETETVPYGTLTEILLKQEPK